MKDAKDVARITSSSSSYNETPQQSNMPFNPTKTLANFNLYEQTTFFGQGLKAECRLSQSEESKKFDDKRRKCKLRHRNLW